MVTIMLSRLKICILLVFAVLATACTTTPVARPVQIDKPVPAQAQPAATAVEKIATLVPEDQVTQPTQPVLQAMDEKGQEKALANLRAFLGAPELEATFKSLESSPNAHNHPAALFADSLGNSYYINQYTLQPIEFTLQQPIQTDASKAKTAEELRALAEQFAKDHSTRFARWQDQLTYTEGIKGENNFFRWEAAGTDVGGMPAIFQVGFKQDGTLFSYLNSLDFLP